MSVCMYLCMSVCTYVSMYILLLFNFFYTNFSASHSMIYNVKPAFCGIAVTAVNIKWKTSV